MNRLVLQSTFDLVNEFGLSVSATTQIEILCVRRFVITRLVRIPGKYGFATLGGVF